jgi:chemotaxis methyl-accepting protein methylase
MVERLVRRLAAGRSRNRSGGSRPPAEGYRDRASTQTRFFRNEPQLSAVVRAVARTWQPGASLDVLHVGGSIGCEALSFVIAMKELDPRFRLRVLSTDVDVSALEYARRQRYDEEWFRPILGEGGMAESLRAKWFTVHTDQERRQYVPDAALTEHVRFDVLDMRQPEPAPRADVVFCQNVLIHMNSGLAERCLRNVLGLVRAPGLLICAGMDLDLRRVIHDEGLRPVTDSLREIHEAWVSHRTHFREDRGRYYFELEDIDEGRADWLVRYCSIFAKDPVCA